CDPDGKPYETDRRATARAPAQEPPTASKVWAGFAGNRRPRLPARIGIDGEIPWSLPATTRRQSCLDCLFALSAFRSLPLPMPGKRTDKAPISSRDTRTRRRASRSCRALRRKRIFGVRPPAVRAALSL